MFGKIRSYVNAKLQAFVTLTLHMAATALRKTDFDAFMDDKRGKVDIVELILLGVAFYVIAYLFPLAIQAIINANMDGWDPTLVTVWEVLFPALGVFIVIIYLVREVQQS